jgi:hypothetical protein
VVIFVTGGMWIIGYKAWGALLASRLRAAGCVVACLDYRNFPQGTVSDMTADVAAGVAWVLRHARGWGGDASRCAHVRACVRACVCVRCECVDEALTRVFALSPSLLRARVTLVGQSAGAHLCALALLYQAQRCAITRPHEHTHDAAMQSPFRGTYVCADEACVRLPVCCRSEHSGAEAPCAAWPVNALRGAPPSPPSLPRPPSLPP